ncbi:MAG: DUF481 domain-containing protein [Pseudomonadota bacterium]
MNKHIKLVALLALSGLLGTASVYADTVLLNNGDRLTGKVDSISGGHVLLITEYAGGVSIDLAAVAELSTEEAFDVEVGDVSTNGKFVVSDGQQSLAADDSVVSVDLGQVASAGQSNLGLPGFTSEWSSRADLSAIISSGNSDTESYNTLIESILKRANSEHSLTLLISQEEAEGETTKDQLDLDYGYKRFLSEKWYAAGNGEYFKDELKDIDQRITLGAGMGYQFWDNSFGAFSTELGVSVVQEELDGEDETNPAIRWGLDYNRFFLSKRMEFFHKQSLLVIPDSDRGEVLASSTGVRYALNSRIDATARADVNHETDPPEDASKTDVTYTLGIGIKF